MTHDRDYRRVTEADIASATRGLGLAVLSNRALEQLAQDHGKIDMFASAVICAAVIREMDARRPRPKE